MVDVRQINEENLRAAEAFARLLSMDGAWYTAQEVDDFAHNCGLTSHEAFLLLVSATLGMENDRAWISRYLSPAVTALSPQPFVNNAYCHALVFPEVSKGRWQFTHLSYAPYQLFPCGHMRLNDEGREIPLLGYFTVPFSYPAVLENGREWMTVTPNEIATMAGPLAAARGQIAVFGLGLGYFALMASEKKEVASVTIIERDRDVVSLFLDHLLSQFPHREKIRIVQSDAFSYLAGPMAKEEYDFAFVDLWHDVGDGIDMYLRCRKMERLSPCTIFQYWIEQDMLIFLRSLMIDDILNRAGKLDKLVSVSPEALTLSLTRDLALRVTPEDVK
ncbi:MAG: hypothetical protein IJ189_04140 [Clostridia bacterium]|nr:hypothetical protein [Clostridia bacterium]